MSNAAPGWEKYPDHRVDISPFEGSVVVKLETDSGETVIAESQAALLLEESRHANAYYLPLADIDADVLTPTDTSTYCPFKGHASYWSVKTDGGEAVDALWAYQTPYDECEPLIGYGAFYTSKVAVYVDGERLT